MRNLIDSSVWVALFLDFDTQHERAAHLFTNLKGKMYVPYCVLNETVTVLAYKHSKQQADRFLEFIENNRNIVFVDDILSDEIIFYKSLSARISFADAALLLLTKKLKAKLITFDQQLEQIGKKNQKS